MIFCEIGLLTLSLPLFKVMTFKMNGQTEAYISIPRDPGVSWIQASNVMQCPFDYTRYIYVRN